MKKLFTLCLASFLITQTILAQRESSRPVPPSTKIPDPVLVWGGLDTSVKGSDGNPYIGITLGIYNYAQFPAMLFTRDSTLPPCGTTVAAARAWLRVYDAQGNKEIYIHCGLNSPTEMRTFSFNVKRENLPRRIYVVIDDRAARKSYKSNCINAANGEACTDSPIINANNIKIGKGIEKINPEALKLLKPDLRVTDIYASDDNNLVTVIIKNNCKGEVTASFPVSLYIRENYDPKSKTVFSRTRTMNTKLPAGYSTPVEFNISEFSKGKDIFNTYVFEILIDSANLIDESKETNNTVTFKGKKVSNFPELPCDGK
jgi:hypothetical protein